MKNLKNWETFNEWDKWTPKKVQSETSTETSSETFTNHTISLLNRMVDQIITSFEVSEDKEQFRFTLKNGTELHFIIRTDSPEELGYIEEIENYEALENSKVLAVDYDFNDGAFLKIRTLNGYVVIEMRGNYGYEVALEPFD